MSAYMVDRAHVRFLVTAARLYSMKGQTFQWYHAGKWTKLDASDRAQLGALGQLLWDANLKSINARYPDTITDVTRATDETLIYAHASDFPYAHVTPVQVLKSVACLEYQCCEFDGWEASEAHAVCKALESAAIDTLPGYAEAAWGAPSLSGTRWPEGR